MTLMMNLSPAAIPDRVQLDELLERSRARINAGCVEQPSTDELMVCQFLMLPLLNDDGVRDLVRQRMED